MDKASFEFNKQLELDVLLNGLTEVTHGYIDRCEHLDFTEVVIPEGVKVIGDHAFNYCRSLTNITIPDTVTRIGNHAFEYCRGLTNITIPRSVTSIGNYAFEDCDSLTRVTFEGKIRDKLLFMWGYPWGLPLEKISVQV